MAPRSATHPPRTRRAAACLAAALLCACQADRRLIVTSQPPGAEVRLDGTRVGRTPYEHPFLHYGTRRVSLYLDGHLAESRVVELEPPWYGRFPVDLFSEVLLPLGWKDFHRVHVNMVPGTGTIAQPDLESVLERAESLRRGMPEGPRPQPPPPASELPTPPPPPGEEPPRPR